MSVKNLLYVLVITLVLAFSLVAGACSSSESDSDSSTPSDNTTEQPQINQKFESISVNEAYNLIQENAGNEDFIIIDLRTQNEFNSGHIEGALNIDYYASDFSTKLKALERDKTYLIYCASGNRSGNAFDSMRNLDFLTVYNMLGGMSDWKSKDLPFVN